MADKATVESKYSLIRVILAVRVQCRDGIHHQLAFPNRPAILALHYPALCWRGWPRPLIGNKPHFLVVDQDRGPSQNLAWQVLAGESFSCRPPRLAWECSQWELPTNRRSIQAHLHPLSIFR